MSVYTKQTTFANVSEQETFMQDGMKYVRIPSGIRKGHRYNARSVSGREVTFWFNDDEIVFVLER